MFAQNNRRRQHPRKAEVIGRQQVCHESKSWAFNSHIIDIIAITNTG